jgi:hypothetical protein
MIRYFYIAFVMACAASTHAQEAKQNTFIKPLMADLSTRHIDMHSGFTGIDVLLYGARNIKGDIIITLTGPTAQITLRKKEKIAGMWMNTRQIHAKNVPAFYAIASTAPLKTLLGSTDIRACITLIYCKPTAH